MLPGMFSRSLSAVELKSASGVAAGYATGSPDTENIATASAMFSLPSGGAERGTNSAQGISDPTNPMFSAMFSLSCSSLKARSYSHVATQHTPDSPDSDDTVVESEIRIPSLTERSER
eukprot:5650688-Karenia_brevis.AAC.1